MNPMQLSVLSDLTRYLSCEEEPFVSDVSDKMENYYKLRLEAAEGRYSRMKALVGASLQKQAEMQDELSATRITNLANELGVDGSDGTAMLWNTLGELKLVKLENQKLVEMNRCLRGDAPMQVPSVLMLKDPKVEGELIAARRQINAMDLELVRMNDQQFEIEERLREYQDVIDHLLGVEPTLLPEPVHPRFHPIGTCSSTACQNYVKRLRNGLRQAVADAYVRDRRVRIHGHYQQIVRPIEELRSEKDQQIRDLRLRLARLECVTLRSADDVSMVDEAKAVAVSELEQIMSEADAVRSECSTLQLRRDELIGEMRGLQSEISEARKMIEESRERSSLCKAEMQCLANERERAERAWNRVQSFLGGQMAVEFERMQFEYRKLEHELEVSRQRMQETLGARVGPPEDDSPVKRVGTQVFTKCKCGKSVLADEIHKHILADHGAQPGVIPCPCGCGFFANDKAEMFAHVRGKECSDRTRAIKRLKGAMSLV